MSVSVSVCVCVRVPDLEEVQEAGLCGARLPHHGHGCAEVVDVLAVGVQHHGLGKLVTHTQIQYMHSIQHTGSGSLLLLQTGRMDMWFLVNILDLQWENQV